MIGLLATALCLWFIAHLFVHDARENPDVSPALWVPLAWMFLAGSRYVSSWLSLGSPTDSGSYDEGSPVDRMVFFALLMAGLVILYRRRMDWGQVVAANKLILSYLLFCLVSILWSDEPFIGFKRWIKDLGNPVMALVILTEPKPLQALGTVLRRLSYLMLPLSVLFVRYFPELGRVYHYDGSPMYTGVGHQKNALGQMCLVTGIYFAWQVLLDREHFVSWTRARRLRMWVLIAMLGWLLYMSNSQTSLSALVLTIAILLTARMGFVARQPTRLLGLLITGALFFAVLEAAFDLKNTILELLGRDPGLTNRTDLWAILFDVAAEHSNAVVGTGFMSFWAGDRLAIIWSRLGAGVLQAHSGYIEQYLNLGYVGVAFIVLLLLRGLFGARALARTDPAFAHLRLCFVVAAIAYNYTEAAFYGINNMWVLLLCGVIAVPQREDETVADPRPVPGPARRTAYRPPPTRFQR